MIAALAACLADFQAAALLAASFAYAAETSAEIEMVVGDKKGDDMHFGFDIDFDFDIPVVRLFLFLHSHVKPPHHLKDSNGKRMDIQIGLGQRSNET